MHLLFEGIDGKRVGYGASRGSKPLVGTMRFLALADLRHEWLLNLCLILALAAILAPLLLLLGLKHGTIQTLRERLVEDPVYRELKPQQGVNLDDGWFATMAAREDVAFVVPTILRGSSIVRMSNARSRESEPMDLLPTGPGDVLILENGGVIPVEGEGVLSFDAADKLGVTTGNTVQVKVTRSREGRLETATVDLDIVHVLSPQADALQRLYAPLQFVLDVETYREGRSVPGRGWAGGAATPYLSFDGVLVVAPKGLSRITARSLSVATGFSITEPITATEFTQRMGLTLPVDFQAYDVHSLREPVQWSSVQAVKDKLRGRGAIVLPYTTQDVALTLGPEDDRPMTIRVIGLSPSPRDREILDIPELPWDRIRPDTGYGDYAQILLPEPMAPGMAQHTVWARLAHQESPMFPLRISGSSFGRLGIVPAELMGVLRTGVSRKIVYSAGEQSLVLARTSYNGFRFYARSIDDVMALHRLLRQQGIETIAKVQEIERVRVLDRGLTRLFWLVAVVGIVGGIAALVASLYAAVERKKRDLSMMRLLGLSRFDVSRFPIYQSATIAALAAVLAILGFFALAAVINTVFSTDLGLGERICQLPPSTLLITFVLTVSVSVLSSLFAALRTTRIEPGEAIRVE